jgi:hypothetical protein
LKNNEENGEEKPKTRVAKTATTGHPGNSEKEDGEEFTTESTEGTEIRRKGVETGRTGVR